MRVLILSDSYPPELRSASLLMKELADALSKRGHEVFVATSYPSHNLADIHKISFPIVADENGVKVLRIKTPRHHNVNFILKGIIQLLLPLIFWRAIKKNIGKIDVVILHSPPLPLTITAARVKRYYKAKFILNLHDFFPQNAVDLGILKNNALIKFFEDMERAAYKNSDSIVVPSNEHKRFLEEKRGIAPNKINVVPHWIDLKPFKEAIRNGNFRKKYKLEDKFIFLFAGVLGPSQGLDLIIRLAERLKTNNEIHFLFVGDGTEKEKLVKMVENKNLSNVSFEEWVSKEEYPNLLKDVDVGIISLTSLNTTPAVPAKLIGYMAASLPVIGFLHKESEGHLIINESGCGISTDYDDEEAAFEAVLSIYTEKNKLKNYGLNGLKYAEKNFTPEIVAEKWEELF